MRVAATPSGVPCSRCQTRKTYSENIWELTQRSEIYFSFVAGTLQILLESFL